ncbi:hypothetical protein Pcinc_003054 [Petrolisthes cinctipes]|uniref:Uncharacterized protein n=1 Tax=Petrolisthes cinctipes TaxID=88211 RepID=A0AAE1L1I6_PETCI|nr:hypothetical protein Pcinc_003054 [Petrolisthes cinctipes]
MNVLWVLSTLVLFLLSFITPNVRAEDVDGAWTKFSALHTQCTSECDGGVTIRARSCTKPWGYGATGETVQRLVAVGQRVRLPMCGNETCKFGDLQTLEGDCNTWNRRQCESPCTKVNMERRGESEDDSDDEDPKYTCVCTMGYDMAPDNKSCVNPLPTEPTPRPHPLHCRLNRKCTTHVRLYSLCGEEGRDVLTSTEHVVGWGLAAVFILFCIAFEFMHYGGEYHCWLQMNTHCFMVNSSTSLVWLSSALELE